MNRAIILTVIAVVVTMAVLPITAHAGLCDDLWKAFAKQGEEPSSEERIGPLQKIEHYDNFDIHYEKDGFHGSWKPVRKVPHPGNYTKDSNTFPF